LPTLTIIAGPNGSGKSTLGVKLALRGRDDIVDPDRIAKGMNPDDPGAAAVAAGRFAVEAVQEHLAKRESFAIETTLASKRTLGLIQQAKRAGFETELVYICLDSPERNLARVGERVMHGGHSVPPGDIVRRYWRSIENAREAIGLADRAQVFDNSSFSARRVLEVSRGVVTWCAPDEPWWCRRIREGLTPRAEA
jgi:predicted ABC-type ATPase